MNTFFANVPVCHRCRLRDGGTCTADPQRRSVSALATAGTCPLNLFPSAGLGDTIAKAIQAVTLGLVRPCGGCEERRKLLNRLVPYADPPDPDSRAPGGR